MEKYRYAGKKMKIKKGVGIITPGDKAEGLVFEVEDYWIIFLVSHGWIRMEIQLVWNMLLEQLVKS